MDKWQQERVSEGLRLAVLGHPIRHSLSPQMQRAALRSAGLPGEYKSFDVVSEKFAGCVSHLRAVGYAGVNVTIPHKEAAAAIAEVRDSNVLATGAANTLVFRDSLHAYNTDVGGVIAITRSIPPTRALVLGAGGAARAVCLALTRLGFATQVWNRTRERAVEMISQLGPAAEVTLAESPDPSNCGLIVNCTAVGFSDDECPSLVWASVHAEMTFFDLAYRTEPTQFLSRAAMIGAKTIDGRELLVEQGAQAFELWTGRSADRTAMRESVGLPTHLG